jgi:hypothetical protein
MILFIFIGVASLHFDVHTPSASIGTTLIGNAFHTSSSLLQVHWVGLLQRQISTYISRPKHLGMLSSQ